MQKCSSYWTQPVPKPLSQMRRTLKTCSTSSCVTLVSHGAQLMHRLNDNFVSHASSVLRRPSGIVDEDMFKWHLPTNDVKKVRR